MTTSPHPFGLHRSLDPPGVLPQVARRLDATPRALDNEIAVAVRALSIDSASFRQLRETEASTGEAIRDQIARIVRERGKMQNPVTGSGGMLLGEVTEIGPRHPAAGALRPGDRIASLVSLTLTPLSLDAIGEIHVATERVDVRGTAILFERTLFARLPEDFPEAVALAAFDVAGAPATVLRDAKPGSTVLVIGTGKAGLLCIAAAREKVGGTGRVFAVEPSGAAADRARALGLADEVFAIDARDPVAMLEAIEGATDGRMADLVVNVANASGTEAASVLCARDDGTVLFFGMATSFSAAALGAEGLARPTALMIGNGFVPGHDETALALLRRHPVLAAAFASLSGKPGAVTAAAGGLSDTIRRSGARRVAFLGLAKNVGKTTALVAVLEEMGRRGVRVGTTSAGRDGESFDAITGEAKPRFRLWPGQLIASAASTFPAASFPTAVREALPFSTRFGDVEVRRAEGSGEIEVIGPSTASQMAETVAALERAGAELVLLDGAIGRRAFAGARVADGIVLSVGMAAGESIESVLEAARAAVYLIGLPLADQARSAHPVDGALTDLAIGELRPRAGEVLVAEDFTAVFLTPAERRRLAQEDIGIAVRRPARLLAVTANPTAPGRPPLPARKLFDALARELPGMALFDLVADLQSMPEAGGERP